MRAATIRFTEPLWELLEQEAGRQGTSVAQLVRDAALMRAAFAMGDRGDPEARATLRSIARDALDDLGTAPPVDVADPAALLDVPADATLDRLTRLAARVLHVPMALVSLVGSERHHIRSCVGVAEPWASRGELPLTHSYCRHVVVAQEPLIVADAREHPLLRDNPAIRDLGAVAYAGVPLTTSGGRTIGTVCAIDREPRTWSSDDVAVLADLAEAALTTLELRAALRSARGD